MLVFFKVVPSFTDSSNLLFSPFVFVTSLTIFFFSKKLISLRRHPFWAIYLSLAFWTLAIMAGAFELSILLGLVLLAHLFAEKLNSKKYLFCFAIIVFCLIYFLFDFYKSSRIHSSNEFDNFAIVFLIFNILTSLYWLLRSIIAEFSIKSSRSSSIVFLFLIFALLLSLFSKLSDFTAVTLFLYSISFYTVPVFKKSESVSMRVFSSLLLLTGLSYMIYLSALRLQELISNH